MVKAHKSFLISLILVSCILISICAFLFFAQSTAYADPTYTVTVYEFDNDAVDKKGSSLGSISNLTQITAQTILDQNFEVIAAEYDYLYYVYDADADDKLGVQIETEPLTLEANVDILRIKTIKKFTVKYVDYDNTELEVQEVEYGSVPTYHMAEPTRAKDAQYTYAFDYWSPLEAAITADTTYTAVYKTTTNKYTVMWVDYNDNLLEQDTGIEYGTMPSYDGSTPLRESDGRYEYTFSNWSPSVDIVKGDMIYKANYSVVKIEYTVTYAYPEKFETRKIYFGDNFGEVKDPEKTGYKFVNWMYEDEPVDISKVFEFTESITLIPKFVPYEYTLAYTIDNSDTQIIVEYEQENIDLRSEKLNAYLENNFVFGFYVVKENGERGDIVANQNLIINKWTYASNMQLGFVSIPKDKEYLSSFDFPKLEGFNVKCLIDETLVENSATFNIVDVGNHVIKIFDEHDQKIYEEDILVREDFGFESGEEFDSPIYLTAVNAKVYVDGKEVDPAKFRVDKNGSHLIKVVGVNGYENTYTIKYNNGNIIKAVWLIGISAIALIIFIVLLALGRRRVVRYGSN